MALNSSLFFNVVHILSLLTLFVAGVIGLIQFRTLPLSLRYLVGLILFGVAVETVVNLLWYFHAPNLFLFPIDAAGEFLLLSLVYRWALQSPGFSRVQPWLAGGVILYAVISSVLLPETSRFKPGLHVVENLLVLMLVGLYFRKLLNELQVQHLARDPMVWVSGGLLFYCLGKLQIVLFSTYMQHYSKQLNLTVWAVHALLTVVLYCCYCRALWLRPQS